MNDKKTYAIYVLSSWLALLIIMFLSSVFINCFYLNNIYSIVSNAEKLEPRVKSINFQCGIIEKHINKSNNAIIEVYKEDLKTVIRNGKSCSLIDYNYDKGYKKLIKILEYDNGLKGIKANAQY